MEEKKHLITEDFYGLKTFEINEKMSYKLIVDEFLYNNSHLSNYKKEIVDQLFEFVKNYSITKLQFADLLNFALGIGEGKFCFGGKRVNIKVTENKFTLNLEWSLMHMHVGSNRKWEIYNNDLYNSMNQKYYDWLGEQYKIHKSIPESDIIEFINNLANKNEFQKQTEFSDEFQKEIIFWNDLEIDVILFKPTMYVVITENIKDGLFYIESDKVFMSQQQFDSFYKGIEHDLNSP